MKRIPLRARDGSVRAYAIVDDADFEHLSERRWSLAHNGYAVRGERHGGRQRLIQMHRVVLGLRPGEDRYSDHINGDRLDNRRANLRVATYAENNQNTRGRGGASRHRGVARYRREWRAYATVDGETKHLGCFKTEDEAAEVARAFRAEHMPFAVEAAA